MQKIIINGQDYTSIAISNIKVIDEDGTEHAGNQYNNDSIKSIVSAFLESINVSDCLNFYHLKNRKGENDNLLYESSIEKEEYLPLRFHVVGKYRNPQFMFGTDVDVDVYDIELNLSSRFDDPSGKKAYFMAEMIRSFIQRELNVKLSEYDVPFQEEDIFQFLKICIFRKKLVEAVQKGFYKQYTYFQKNDSHLRGRIDVSQLIRLNRGMNNGRIAYEYREKTTDNSVNHLILHTYHELEKEYPEFCDAILASEDTSGANALSILRQLEYLAPGYSFKSLPESIRESRKEITHSFFTEYEELRQTCIQILEGMDISIYDEERDSKDEVQSMLFYVPDLWESYVEDILNKYKNEKIYQIVSQKPLSPLTKFENNIGYSISQQEKSYKEPTPIKDEAYLRPDFVIQESDQNIAVLDAKFKPGWEIVFNSLNDTYFSFKDDIKQCIVYLAVVKVQFTGVIFPMQENDKDSDAVRMVSYHIGESDHVFAAFGIRIPNPENETFEQWKNKIDQYSSCLADLIFQNLLCSR